MSISIRAASEADYATIESLARAIWPSAYGHILPPGQIDYMLERLYNRAALAEQVNSKQHVFHLAVDDEVAVGFVSHQFDFPQAGATKIHKLYVLPALHGRGVGRLLIEHVAAIASAVGQRSLMLNVNKYNKAQDFYRKVGFEIVGAEDIDIGEGFLMEDVIMRRALV